MRFMGILILLLCFYCFSPLYGQNGIGNEKLNKLSFNSGIPEILKKKLVGISDVNCIFSAIPLDIPKDTLFIIVYRVRGEEEKYYRVRKNYPGDIIRFDLKQDPENGGITKRINLDDDESYNYLIWLSKTEEGTFYSISNTKKKIEHGLVISSGIGSFSELTGNSSGNLSFQDKSGGLNEFGYSVKYQLNNNSKIEIQSGLLLDRGFFGANIGAYLHYRLKKNLYVAAGLNVFARCRRRYWFFISDKLILTYILPTVSIVHYFSPKFYSGIKCYFNPDNDKKKYEYNLNSGLSLIFGMNF